MNVVGHQRPSEAICSGLNEEFREVNEKSSAVGVVPEDIAAINTANNYMLEQVGNIETGGSWHNETVTKARELVN